MKKGVIFATYSSLIGESQSGGKYKTRLKQLLHWCGEDFDGVVSFIWSSVDYKQIAIEAYMFKDNLVFLLAGVFSTGFYSLQ